MTEAAQEAVGKPPSMNLVADAGYSNGERAETYESKGILPHVSANRATNNEGDGTLFDRTAFRYDAATDTFDCPAGQALMRKQLRSSKNRVAYTAPSATCRACPLKDRCTPSPKRHVHRPSHEDALERMRQRATPAAMRLRRSTVEHPFGTLKCLIFGQRRFLLSGCGGAQTEISLATVACNLKQMMKVSVLATWSR